MTWWSTSSALVGHLQFSVHLTDPLDVSRLAAKGHERNFRRVFLREVGSNPLQFIKAARLEAGGCCPRLTGNGLVE